MERRWKDLLRSKPAQLLIIAIDKLTFQESRTWASAVFLPCGRSFHRVRSDRATRCNSIGMVSGPERLSTPGRRPPPEPEKHWDFFSCVQPILAAMRLKIGRRKITSHLTGRDRRNNFAFHRFIGQFAVSPVIDWSARQFRWLTGDRQNLSPLFGCELPVSPASRPIIQNIFNRTSKFGVRLTDIQ